MADEDADIFLIQRIAEMGLIECVSVPRGIVIDAGKFTGRTLTNLVNMIAGKEQLINRVVGEQAFHMKESFVEELRKTAPNTVNYFMDVLNACGGEAAMKGLCFTGRKLIFTGFPEKEEFRILAERMVETALSSKWVKAKTVNVTRLIPLLAHVLLNATAGKEAIPMWASFLVSTYLLAGGLFLMYI